MKLPPRFTIYDKSNMDQVLYWLLAAAFIVGYLFIIFGIPFEWNLDTMLVILVITIGIVVSVLLSLHAASVAGIQKKIIFDGLNLYFYYGDKLKRKVNFKTVKEIGSNSYHYRGFPIYYVYIRYHIDGKRKSLGLYEDEFSKQGLKNIFWNLVRSAEYYNVKIKDWNYWMKEVLMARKKLIKEGNV